MIPNLSNDLIDLVAQSIEESHIEQQEQNYCQAEYNRIMDSYHTTLSEIQYFETKQLEQLINTALSQLSTRTC